jgi:hypothetical protein
MEHKFINIAEKDLKNAKLFYDLKRYPDAIYYLQQTTEKATKGLGIGLGIITYEDAKSPISHFISRFGKYFFVYLRSFFHSEYKEKELNIKEEKEIGRIFEQIDVKFKEYDVDIIDKELSILMNIEKFKERIDLSFIPGGFLVHFISELILIQILKTDEFRKELFPIIRLCYLGIILSHHNQLTRYPIKINNKVLEPNDYYNEGNPLVVNFRFIEKSIEESFTVVNEALKNKHLFEIQPISN